MKKYAKKTKILGRIFLAAAIIAALAFIGGIFAFSQAQDTAVTIIFLGFFVSITFFIIYFVKFFWFGHTFRFFQETGREQDLDDIELTVPTLKRAQIYCGKKAFFCKRTGSVVAYDQLAWIYSIGGSLGEYTIRLKNGKRAYVIIDSHAEMLTLLNNYVAPNNPNTIIEGKTVHAKEAFLKRYPEANRNFANGKIIGGSILSIFPLVSIIVGLINGTFEAGNLIVAGVLEAVGLSLLLYGLKGPYLVSRAAAIRRQLTQSALFNRICNIGTVLAIVCMLLLIASGVLRFEPLFIPALIGYFIGALFLFGSIFLGTGFFAKGLPTFYIKLPEEKLDDTSYIAAVSVAQNRTLYIYTFLLTQSYGWDDICAWVDHLITADLDKDSLSLAVNGQNAYTDITNAYLKGKKKGTVPTEWANEHSLVRVFGKSKVLNSTVSVVFHNQTKFLRVSLALENQEIATAYAETLIRRNFGTPDQLKLAKPAPERVPVSIGEDHSIHLDSVAFARYLQNHPAGSMYEFCGAIALNEKEPVLRLYDGGIKTREYRLQTEGDEDFTGKYFLISVRLGLHGNPVVPTAQIDGFISDTPDERQFTSGDIGYRMEAYFLACGGAEKERYELLRGQDLPMKALKYPGYTTPSNIRLIGICPECGKSFCFHGYAFYMAQSDIAYSDDGLDCCEIQSYGIDKESWVYETDGKTFRYYNSFCCPHCKTPYIDYKKYPENKVFGVSGCVLLGRKHFQYR